ncbi:MAG: phage head spike fiber domain-containing protein [Methylobacter sp.]
MTGDQSDISKRIKALIPPWLGDVTPYLDSLIQGMAYTGSFVYSLIAYAKLQTRIKTATDGWLDMISADFFGSALPRQANQSDTSFRNRIIINLFRERATRAGIVKVLQDLTGRTPVIFEPLRPLDTGAYGAAVAVSRTSVGSYYDMNGVLQYAPVNTPRFSYNPANLGAGASLLLEGAAANLLKYSEQFDNAAWTKGNTTITANAITAPDGTSTADKLVENTTASVQHYTQQNYTGFTAGTQYTFSCFIKAAERTKLQLQFNTAAFGVYVQYGFDIVNGTVSTILAGTNSYGTISNIGNGWYKCSITAQATVTTTGQGVIILHNASDSATYTGDGTSGLYIWGVQLEVGNYATSYIPTTTAAVTRSAETLLNNMPTSGAALGGYGLVGGYGSMLLPFQAFVTAYRPTGSGVPNVAGYGVIMAGSGYPIGGQFIPEPATSAPGGYGVGAIEYASMNMIIGAVTDSDIYAAVDSVKPVGTTIWTNITS